jgi:hypothetical protein
MLEGLPRKHNIKNGSSDRTFGLVFAAFFLVIGLLPLLHGHVLRIWALLLAVAFLVVAMISPVILSPLNRLWTRFGLLLHSIVSPVALAILFYGVVTPTGLLMRLFGKAPLCLRLDKDAASYWIERTPPGPEPESLKYQF